MKTTLSHSQIGRYQMCPKSYEYHYIHKIRPKVHSAALVFGSAIDNALNVILTGGQESAEDLFEQSFRWSKINNVDTYIPTCTDLVYANSDFDSDLLTEEDYTHIKEQSKKGFVIEHADYLELYSQLKELKQKKGFLSLGVDQKVTYNLLNWLSLYRKGLLMLSAYRKKVMPKIEKVHEVQKKVVLQNNVGDEIVGYVDLIADIKGIGTVILDNKTSSMEYDENAVLTSPQLTLYMHILEQEYNTRKAGYIVMRKSVIKNRKKVCTKCGYDGSGGRHKTCDAIVEGKRCNGEWKETIDPDIHIQFITDEIPQQTEDIVMENIDNTNEAIKHGVFTRNFNSCQNFYGSVCPYFGKCFKGNDEGLVDGKKKS